MSRASLFVPLGAFLLLSCLLLAGFYLNDPGTLPSELIDRPVPDFSLDELHSGEQMTEQDLPAEPFLVNVWASWCPGCLVEHPYLMRIATNEKVPLIGLNYSDEAGDARAWLERHRNPYEFILHDPEGRLAIGLGVYGAPETFVLDHRGIIRYRHVGPVDWQAWQETLRPLLQRLRRQQAGEEGV